MSGLCCLSLLQFSFLNVQTLHNDHSYIEHVNLFLSAHVINIFLFLCLPHQGWETYCFPPGVCLSVCLSVCHKSCPFYNLKTT